MTATTVTAPLTGPRRTRAIKAVKAVAGINGRKAGRILDGDEPIVDLNPTVAPDALIRATVDDYLRGTVTPTVVAALVAAELPTVGEPDARVMLDHNAVTVYAMSPRGTSTAPTRSVAVPLNKTSIARVTELDHIDVPGGIKVVPTFAPDTVDEPGKAASAVIRAVLIQRAFDVLERLIFDEQMHAHRVSRQDPDCAWVASIGSMHDSWRQMPDEVRQALVSDIDVADTTLARLMDRLRPSTPLDELFV